jgi:calcineurin-like phosphoesterase family protein
MAISSWTHFDDDIHRLWEQQEGSSYTEIAKQLLKTTDSGGKNTDVDRLRTYIRRYVQNNFSDKEIILDNVKLAKQKQKAMDQNRIANKSFREHARIENAIEELAKAIKEQNREFGKELKKLGLKPFKKAKVVGKGTGIIQITDTHCNELVDLPHNKYDFNIFAKRLRKHILDSLSFFKHKGIDRVILINSGDTINSDRRRDEILAASTNRAKAAILTTHILKQAILEIRKEYPVSVVGVLGNESRIDQEMTFSKEGLADNYDFLVMAQLHQMFTFAGIKDVEFLGYSNLEEVIKIEDQNWLVCHNLSRMLDEQKGTQAAIGRYSLSGIQIDFIIGGHVHACRITDISARSSAMVGSNTYNEHSLNLMGKATHNAYWCKGKERVVIVNDLQDVDHIEGYEVISQLEAYNAKSVDKIRKSRTILQINTVI